MTVETKKLSKSAKMPLIPVFLFTLYMSSVFAINTRDNYRTFVIFGKKTMINKHILYV